MATPHLMKKYLKPTVEEMLIPATEETDDSQLATS